MLQQAGGEPFCSGRSVYADQPSPAVEPTAKIYVKVQPAGLEGFMLFQLDTGSPYTVLDPEIAQGAGVVTDGGIERTLMTARGVIRGLLVRHVVTLIADEGDSLQIEATVFVPIDEWPPRRSFLGYRGLLENIRIALDPQKNHFYFGPAD